MNRDIEEIVLTKDHLQQIKQVLSSSRLETVVFLFGKIKSRRGLVTDLLIPSEKEYCKRTLSHVEVSEEFVVKEFNKFEKQEKTLLSTIHSHSMKGLSFGDAMTHMNVIKFYPYQLTGIFNRDGFYFYKYDNGLTEIPYRVLDLKRFDRQVRAFGRENQILISTTCVALIGVGGGNSKIAFDLSGLGIGKLILVDPDVWEETNRNRVLIPPSHVRLPKVKSVEQIVKEFYPSVQVESYVSKAEELPEDVYAKADILIVGPDAWSTREFGNKLALRLNKSAIFPAAGIRVKDGRIVEMGGSVQVVIPNTSPCFQCINTIDSFTVMKEILSPEEKRKLAKKYGVSLDVEVAPSIVFLNNVIGGLAIWELIKLITGIDEPVHLQVYDALKDELITIDVSKNPKCPCCGEVETMDEKEVEESTTSDEEILSAVERNGEKGVLNKDA